MPNALRVEVGCNAPRPQCEYFDVGPAQLVAEGVGEAFLESLGCVVDCLAREWRHLESSDRCDVEDSPLGRVLHTH